MKMRKKEESDRQAPITPRNIWRHELIGLDIKVKDSTSKFNIGIFGTVIDETKNMLIIYSNGKKKYLPKNISKFCFTLPNGKKVEVNGKKLIGRPEDRVKKILRRW